MGAYSHWATLFGGVNEYATAGHPSSLSISFTNAEDFSLIGWFRLGPIGADEVLISKKDGVLTGYEVLRTATGEIQAFWRGGGGNMIVQSLGTYGDGTYIFVAVTWEGTAGNAAANCKVYVNAIDDTDGTPVSDALGGNIAGPGNFQVAAVNGANKLIDDGLGDFVAVYNDVLTLGEVRALWNATADEAAPGDPQDPRIAHPDNLVAFWPMGDLASFPTLFNMAANGDAGAPVPIKDFSRADNAIVNTNVGPTDISTDNPGGICTHSFAPNGGSERYTVLDSILDRRIRNFKPGVPFSVEFRYKSTTTAACVIASKLDLATVRGWYVAHESDGSGGKISLLLRLGANFLQVGTSTNEHDSTWRHYVLVYDGGDPTDSDSIKCYRQGVDVSNVIIDTFPAGDTFQNLVTTFQISGYDGGNSKMTSGHFLAEPVVYSRALSPAEVTARYNGDVPSHPDVLGDDSIRFYIRLGEDFDNMTMSGMEAADIRPSPAGGITLDETGPPEGAAAELGPSGGAEGTATYVNFAHDAACADGVPPTTWRTVGAPDPTGISAPSFPCGGPWESIWVGQVIRS